MPMSMCYTYISSSPPLVLQQFPRHRQRGIQTDLSCPSSTPLNACARMPMNACTHTSPRLLVSSACSSAVPKAPGVLCCFGFVEVGEISSCHACVSSWVTCKCVCWCRFLSCLRQLLRYKPLVVELNYERLTMAEVRSSMGDAPSFIEAVRRRAGVASL